MSAEYVRNYYRVDFKRGDRVILHDHPQYPTPDTEKCDNTGPDRHGVIVSFPNQYAGVRFDGEKLTSRCHPTWRFGKEDLGHDLASFAAGLGVPRHHGSVGPARWASGDTISRAQTLWASAEETPGNLQRRMANAFRLVEQPVPERARQGLVVLGQDIVDS